MTVTLASPPASPAQEELNGAPPSPSSIVDVTINERIFGIRAADIDARRNSASMLIQKMYQWRGYAGSHGVGTDPNRITLTATDKDEVLGTVSLGLDSEVGLLADQVFKDVIDPYRAKGKVCEIIKLAIDPTIKSKSVLASLFHVAYLYAHDLNDCAEIFIEVNPRHRRFYEAMLGFTVECEPRTNPRVNAPAVLLRANTAWGARQIEMFAGQHENTTNRSLFPYFFSPREQIGILNRLRSIG